MTSDVPAPDHNGIARLAERVLVARTGSEPLVVAITGSVASGKSTLAEHLSGHLAKKLTVETISTDGFLFPNSVLEARDLMMRKGFPETFDRYAMAAAIHAVRTGPAVFPAHSHVIYDIDPALARTITAPDVLILEGLGFAPLSQGERPSTEPDLLVYLDAETEHIEAWFLERFMRFWHAAEHDPNSFYVRFRNMSEDEAREFARIAVWDKINLPNLENHILPLREHADVVVKKSRSHLLHVG
ncbi:type I pantothenate kinase [Henriciella litoralis]|uniref:type I pantothenate kinase n=1 Tax=Henriciella litoralis TaxID=568102 RepID=UPI000A021C99|nr:type I pantothenate kinase [Henriciella litoralis]